VCWDDGAALRACGAHAGAAGFIALGFSGVQALARCLWRRTCQADLPSSNGESARRTRARKQILRFCAFLLLPSSSNATVAAANGASNCGCCIAPDLGLSCLSADASLEASHLLDVTVAAGICCRWRVE